jgi:hypothetical protein
MNNRHLHFLSANAVHFLSQDLLNIPRHAPTERKITIESGAEETHQTSTQC